MNIYDSKKTLINYKEKVRFATWVYLLEINYLDQLSR